MAVIVVFITGLIVGSFLNVVLSRLPNGENFLGGRSRCLFCKKDISWYDLIPVLSFLFLRRRCRNCKEKISWQYPAVELATAIGFTGIFLFTKEPLFAIWLAVLWAISVLISAYDIKHQIIPDSFLLLFFITILAGSGSFIRDTIIVQALSALVLSGFFLALYSFSKGKWIGFGDVKLGFAMGFLLGWPMVLVSLFFTYVGGAFLVLILMAFKRIKLSARIPFGPFIIAGGWTAFLWGREIVNWYLLLSL